MEFNIQGAVPGWWDLEIEHTDGCYGKWEHAFEITGDPLPLEITYRDKRWSADDPNVYDFTIFGIGFWVEEADRGIRVRLQGWSSYLCRREYIEAYDVVVEDDRHITCKFPRPAPGGPLGWLVEVEIREIGDDGVIDDTDTLLDRDSYWGFFEVGDYPVPTLTRILPNVGTEGETVDVEIIGSDFREWPAAASAAEGDDEEEQWIWLRNAVDKKQLILGQSITVVDAEHVTCSFDLTGAQTDVYERGENDFWDLWLRDPEKQMASLLREFVIRPAPEPPPGPPVVTGICPIAGGQGKTVTVGYLGADDVNVGGIEGSGFREGATARLELAGAATIPATEVSVPGDFWGTVLFCKFAIPAGAKLGLREVIVENPDGQNSRDDAPAGTYEPVYCRVLSKNTPPLALDDWWTVGVHANDIGELPAWPDLGAVEPRRCGIELVDIQTSNILDPDTVNTDAITVLGTKQNAWGHCDYSLGHVEQASVVGNGSIIRVKLGPPLPDEDNYTIILADTILDALGQALPAGEDDRSFTVTALRGDVNGDSAVGAADEADLHAHLHERVSEANDNARYDLNMSGRLNSLDVLSLEEFLGHVGPVAAAEGDDTYTEFAVCTPDGKAQATVLPGEEVDLAVRLDTNDRVAAFACDVALSEAGWTLVSHTPGEDWYDGDGKWDASIPQGPETVINVDTYDGEEGVADFRISTVCSPLGTTVTGAQDVAHFRLRIPQGTPPGLYNINLRGSLEASGVDGIPFAPELYDGDGSPLSSVRAGPHFLLYVCGLREYMAAWRSFKQTGTLPAWADLNDDGAFDRHDAGAFIGRYISVMGN